MYKVCNNTSTVYNRYYKSLNYSCLNCSWIFSEICRSVIPQPERWKTDIFLNWFCSCLTKLYLKLIRVAIWTVVNVSHFLLITLTAMFTWTRNSFMSRGKQFSLDKNSRGSLINQWCCLLYIFLIPAGTRPFGKAI